MPAHNDHPPAPWKSAFASHLSRSKTQPPIFSLATATKDGIPSVRTCIHRAFWASSSSSGNDSSWDSDCPIFTTRARMNKLADIFELSSDSSTSPEGLTGSGGGGPVEAVYWFPEINTQWRIRGRCWILAYDDIEADGEAQRTVRDVLTGYMRRGDESTEGSLPEVKWKGEMERVYAELDSVQKGLFKKPPKGQREQQDSEGDTNLPRGSTAKSEHGEEQLTDNRWAIKNFRLAVITPQRVEWYDQSNPADVKIWLYELVDQHKHESHMNLKGTGSGKVWKLTKS